MKSQLRFLFLFLAFTSSIAIAQNQQQLDQLQNMTPAQLSTFNVDDLSDAQIQMFMERLNESGYMMQVAEIPPVEPLPTHQMVITRATVSSTKNREHPDVRIAQALLIAAGKSVGVIDGIAGPKFAEAVKRFQQTEGLTADGIVGPQTWEQLEDAGL